MSEVPSRSVEGVHLLGDDVGFGADAAGEELRLLEDGRADFVVVVGAKNARAIDSTRFQTSVDGGSKSLVPLTALIKVVGNFHATIPT